MVAFGEKTLQGKVAVVTGASRDAGRSIALVLAVVALASDPHLMDKTGLLLKVEDLAREYGFTDIAFTP